jgi:hypothetical protein
MLKSTAIDPTERLPVDPASMSEPPQLSTSESFALQRLRHSFDWKILSHLSHSLVSGSIKEFRLIYPMSIKDSIPSSKLKAMQAIHEHSQTYAKEKIRAGLPVGRTDRRRLDAKYTFNLIAARSYIHGQDVIGIAKKHYSNQSHPPCSLLGLPRGKPLRCYLYPR